MDASIAVVVGLVLVPGVVALPLAWARWLPPESREGKAFIVLSLLALAPYAWVAQFIPGVLRSAAERPLGALHLLWALPLLAAMASVAIGVASAVRGRLGTRARRIWAVSLFLAVLGWPTSCATATVTHKDFLKGMHF